MRIKHPAVQVAVMVVAAMAIAVIANGFAGRTRRLVFPGYYPEALKVPPPEQAAVVAPPVAATTTTIAPMTTTAAVTTTTAPIPTTTTVEPSPIVPTTTIATTTTQQPAPTPQPRTPAAPDLSRFTPHPNTAYIEISGDDAAALHTAGVLFLDARRTSVYEEGHITGARSYSVWEADVDDKVSQLFEERNDPADQNKPIVVYCSGGACEDSHMLSQKLWAIQFNNVYVYKDGYPDWQKRGLPVRSGATP